MSRKVTTPCYRVSIAHGSMEYFMGVATDDLEGTLRAAQVHFDRLMGQWNTARINRQPRGPRPVVRVWRLCEVWDAADDNKESNDANVATETDQ